jgi:hypothetical protein
MTIEDLIDFAETAGWNVECDVGGDDIVLRKGEIEIICCTHDFWSETWIAGRFEPSNETESINDVAELLRYYG